MSRLLTLEASAVWLASGAIVALSDATISTVVVSLCAAVPPTIMAWAALQQAKRATAVTKETVAATKETVAKVDVMLQKSDVIIETNAAIHAATDGNLSRLNTEAAVADQEIKGLKEMVASMTASAKTAEKIATQAPPAAAKESHE